MKFANLNLINQKNYPLNWITELDKIRTQLDVMGHVISGQVARKDLDNKDDFLTLD